MIGCLNKFENGNSRLVIVIVGIGGIFVFRVSRFSVEF